MIIQNNPANRKLVRQLSDFLSKRTSYFRASMHKEDTRMKIIITDEAIRFGIETAASELEEDEMIHFPDQDARAEFIDECFTCVNDKLDMYEHYCPDYRMEILDTAGFYGYLK